MAAGADNARDATDDVPMTIGEVAQEFGVTLRALRFYETRLLLSPQREGSTRLYRRRDRERLMLILTGRRLGFTLAEIAGLVAKPGGNRFGLNREKCVRQISHLERQRHDIDAAIAELRRIYSSFYKPVFEKTG